MTSTTVYFEERLLPKLLPQPSYQDLLFCRGYGLESWYAQASVMGPQLDFHLGFALAYLFIYGTGL